VSRIDSIERTPEGYRTASYDDDPHLSHTYPRPPGPGDRAYCGHVWTPEEGEACWRGVPMAPCKLCGLRRERRDRWPM
jgi:hypothetical protein